MSKTVEVQIEKSRGLIEGLRRHVKEMGERGVSNKEIDEMEQAVKELQAANAEVERLRMELAPKVKNLNNVMDRVKEAYAEKKKTLKGYYPQERWMDYGVPDKRVHRLSVACSSRGDEKRVSDDACSGIVKSVCRRETNNQTCSCR